MPAFRWHVRRMAVHAVRLVSIARSVLLEVCRSRRVMCVRDVVGGGAGLGARAVRFWCVPMVLVRFNSFYAFQPGWARFRPGFVRLHVPAG